MDLTSVWARVLRFSRGINKFFRFIIILCPFNAMEFHLSCEVMFSMGWRAPIGMGLSSVRTTQDDGLLLVR